MKLSKSLLQAIVVGVSLGTAVTSCDIVESTIEPDQKEQALPKDDGGTTTRQSENLPNGTCTLPGDDYENCAACGMG